MKKVKRIQGGEDEVRGFVFADDRILHVKDTLSNIFKG